MVTLKTDFSDGNILYSGATTDTDKLNGITTQVNTNTTTIENNSEIHIKKYTSATEDDVCDGSSSWLNTDKTFTLSAPIGSYVLNVFMKAELDIDGNVGYLNIKISGTNLGDKYIIANEIYGPMVSSTETVANYNPVLDSSEDYLFKSFETSYVKISASLNQPFEILDTSTTFMVRAKTDASGDTLQIKNVEIIVMYATPVTED